MPLSLIAKKPSRSPTPAAAFQRVPFLHPGYAEVERSQLGNGSLVVGSPGSGKTSIIMPWLKKLVGTGNKLITLDVKGEQREKLGVNFLAPWLAGSLVLDIGDMITNLSQSQLLANILVPVPEGKEKIWAAAANSVASTLIYSLVTSKPGTWTWSDLADKLELSIEEWKQLLIQHTPSAAKILEGAEETSNSVAFNVATSLRNLRTVADMFKESQKFGGKRFSVRRWLQEKDYPIKQIILRKDTEYEASSGFIIPFIIDYIGSQISGLPNNISDPKYIVLDEFAQLRAIPSLMEFYEVGRSKGIFALLATQDWKQVEDKYGENKAGIIYSNASIKLICKISASDSQAKMAQLMGSREVAILNVSHSSGSNTANSGPSVSTSHQEKSMPLFIAGDLEKELGPHSYIDNPNPNAPPDQKRIPTKIRAALKPMSGDVFVLDWPVDFGKDVCKSPIKLPSHRPGFEIVKNYLQNPDLSMSDRINAVLNDRAISFDKIDLLNHLYSQGYINRDSWTLARKAGAERNAFLKRFAAHPERFKPNPATTPLPETQTPLQAPIAVATVTPANQNPTTSGIDDLITGHRDEAGNTVYGGTPARSSSGMVDAFNVIGGVLALGIDQLTTTGPTVKVEGLQAEPETVKAESEPKSEADQSDDLAPAALSLVAPNSEVLHTIEIASHVIDALEILGPKQAPAPIIKHDTPAQSTAGLPIPSQDPKAKLAALQKRLQRR